jgi:hypothetical protein
MQHPYHPTFRLPQTFVALVEYLFEDYDRSGVDMLSHACNKGEFFGEINYRLVTLGLGKPELVDDEVKSDDVRYDGIGHEEPIELLDFACDNSSGFSWAVLASELNLDDHPCVSYDPHEDEVVWLGDNTKQALETLLVGEMARWEEDNQRLRRRATSRGVNAAAVRGEPSPAEDPRWAELCHALDLDPDINSTQSAWGARRDRPIRPSVPPGWRYESAGDGVGVLAEADAFVPAPFEIDPGWYGDESVHHARHMLSEGYPATALCILKHTYREPGVMETMREAYQILGRTLHVQRADAWIRENS